MITLLTLENTLVDFRSNFSRKGAKLAEDAKDPERLVSFANFVGGASFMFFLKNKNDGDA